MVNMYSLSYVRSPSSLFQKRQGRHRASRGPLEATSHVWFSSPVLRDEQVWPWLSPQGPAHRETGRLGACPPSALALSYHWERGLIIACQPALQSSFYSALLASLKPQPWEITLTHTIIRLIIDPFEWLSACHRRSTMSSAWLDFLWQAFLKLKGWGGEMKRWKRLERKRKMHLERVKQEVWRLMRNIRLLLWWGTYCRFWRGLPYLKKIYFAFQLEAHCCKWLEGQENWQVKSILLVVDTFLNKVEKWPSFLETRGLSILLCLATQCGSLGFPIACQLLGLPSIHFPSCVPTKPFATSFILSSLTW